MLKMIIEINKQNQKIYQNDLSNVLINRNNNKEYE